MPSPTRGLSDDPAKWLDEAVEACREEQRKRKIQKLLNPRENDVKKAILDYARKLHIPLWRANTGAVPFDEKTPPGQVRRKRWVRFGRIGQADLTGLMPDGTGRRLEVETKRPKGGRQSVRQKDFQFLIEQHNGVYILANSLEEFVKAIKANEKR